ncbi:MAG: hypothetical protein Q8M65_04525 [Rhodoglobus sp.]|nr:hypothetical protein [Rhodoglobus sp.]
MKNTAAPRFWWPTLVSTTIATVATTVHHVFRLGPEVVLPGMLLIALPVLALLWIRARGSGIALGILGALVTLTFVWFGFVDGFLDHVFKAVGLPHVTLLPGGEAEVVETYYSLGGTDTSAAFYEATGIVEALASATMLGFTIALIASIVRARAAKPTAS